MQTGQRRLPRPKPPKAPSSSPGRITTAGWGQPPQKGYDVIITASFGFMDATINVAKDFPETVFVHIAGYKTAENVGTAFGKQEEPRYVAGMISGRMTKSNVI